MPLNKKLYVIFHSAHVLLLLANGFSSEPDFPASYHNPPSAPPCPLLTCTTEASSA